MKNTETDIKDSIITRYLEKGTLKKQPKSSNINVLLNRIELRKKNESRKKIYFSAAASTGLILFGLLIF